MKKLLALATLLLSSTPINSAHALFGDPPTKLFSEEQTWRVGWDQSIGKDGLGICYTHQAFLNKVHIWIGSKIGIEQMSDSWFLAIYIPDLKLKVDDKRKFVFEMQNIPTQSGYKGYELEMLVTEHADHKKFFLEFINKDFANYLATDRKVQWMQINLMGAKFTRLDMGESARGIRGVVGCRKEILAAVAANALENNPENRTENKPKEERASYGTGFFVASGYVLTNYHVVNECTQAYVKYPGFKKAEAYLKGSDVANDLALLSAKMPNDGVAKFSIGARLGESAYAFGFPLGTLLSSSGNFTVGNVSALTGSNDDSRYLQTSTPIQQGNSGGPLLNGAGAVIGVTSEKLNALKISSYTGDIPQNVNFAIQSAIVVNFLTTQGVSPTWAKEQARLEPVYIAEEARKFTVQVSCK